MYILKGSLLVVCLVSIAMAMPAATDQPLQTVSQGANESEPLQTVSQGANEFSWSLFKTVAEENPGNLIMSPLSAIFALAMTAYGARGETENQLKRVLHLPSSNSLGTSGYQALTDTLNNVTDNELKLANKIFPAQKFAVKPDYQELLTNYFRSAVQKVDFSNSREAAGIINTWVQENTNDRIKDLLTSDDVDESTALVLVNAVYFKGQWKDKFDPQDTRELRFHVDETTTKKVPTMYRTGDYRYGYVPGMNATFIEIPYKGDELSMIIFLPEDVNGLNEVQQQLQDINIANLFDDAYEGRVELYLPKFKIESKLILNDVLQKMGLTDMFSDRANFSGIADDDLSISKVVQKAFIEVNEEGSEAAAATAIIAATTSLFTLRPEFRIDRPFVYGIAKTLSNDKSNASDKVFIFKGIVNEPMMFCINEGLIRFLKTCCFVSRDYTNNKIRASRDWSLADRSTRDRSVLSTSGITQVIFAAIYTGSLSTFLQSAFDFRRGSTEGTERKMGIYKGSVLVACLILIGIASQATSNQPLYAISRCTNEFSFSLLKAVVEENPGNLVMSPLSAAIVLAMAAYGAGGETELQLKRVLRLSSAQNLGPSNYQALIDILQNSKENDFVLANNLFAGEKFSVKPSYQQLTENFFRSIAQSINFKKAEEAANMLNAWVQRKTNNRIKEIFSQSEVDSNTGLMLVNAVHFKGLWKKRFNPELTKERPFYFNGNTIKNIPTMYTNGIYKFGELSNLKASFIEIPYQGNGMSMVVILPNEVNGLFEVEKRLEGLNINDILNQGYERELHLYLPKFRIERKIDLNSVLKKLGLIDMFSSRANFSAIADNNLFVSKAIQQAFIEVSEEGSESASATGLSAVVAAALFQPEVKIDRPFIYCIVKSLSSEQSSSAERVLVFAGRVNEPQI
ncbi:uncharacterized protein LOC122404748 [Colletes gigas]|uniref:uncharacterized protein LOC122404748 n=1 Tax=Colletes gigas TaxID=935657 RepID=UPI001C9B1C5F|nr:uncharacterized protein LOC122404748 [Colletes gigas]